MSGNIRILNAGINMLLIFFTVLYPVYTENTNFSILNHATTNYLTNIGIVYH